MDDLIIHDKKTIGLNKDNDWRFRVLYSVKRITMTFRYKNKNLLIQIFIIFFFGPNVEVSSRGVLLKKCT